VCTCTQAAATTQSDELREAKAELARERAAAARAAERERTTKREADYWAVQETTRALAEAPPYLSDCGLAFRVFLTAAAGDPTKAHGYAHQLQSALAQHMRTFVPMPPPPEATAAGQQMLSAAITLAPLAHTFVLMARPVSLPWDVTTVQPPAHRGRHRERVSVASAVLLRSTV
jgi:hypothetical protein